MKKCGRCCILNYSVALVYQWNLGVTEDENLLVWLVKNVVNMVLGWSGLACKILKPMVKQNVMCKW